MSRLFGARLPQIAMLHHRRARPRVWSANISVQAGPSPAFTFEKSFLANEFRQRFTDRQQQPLRRSPSAHRSKLQTGGVVAGRRFEAV
jgi:hypothetical protein